jgi:LL-H family phage holin
MNDNLFSLILAIVPILGTIITLYVIPFIQSKTDIVKLDKYKEWVTLAVKCAEMLYTESGQGIDKKQFVLEYMNKLFNSKKTIITSEQLEILIEAAVRDIKVNEQVGEYK